VLLLRFRVYPRSMPHCTPKRKKVTRGLGTSARKGGKVPASFARVIRWIAPALRQLLLLRHAKSAWDDPGLSDHSRPLTVRGRAAAGAMRQAMLGLALSPDVVLVSSARRTVQTLEALEPWEETPLIEPMDALYLATAPELLKILHGVAETARSVMVIGHNPGLHELAVLLTGSARDPADARRLSEGYPTGALAEFALSGPWGTLAAGGGRLHRFLCPRDLPQLAI